MEGGRNANGEYGIYSSGIVWCRDKDKREWIGLRAALRDMDTPKETKE